MTTKISISLTDQAVAALDRYIAQRKLASRSAGIQEAIDQLAATDMKQEYALAYQEWEDTGEEEDWDITSEDGIR